MIRLLTALLLLLAPVRAADSRSVEYHRGLAGKQKGDLSIVLFGDRVFSHGFKEPARNFFRDKIPGPARVEMIVSITEAPGTVWGSNPMNQNIPEAPARLCLVLQRDWHTQYGRWFSVQSIEVRPGVHRLVVPVEPWAWVSVFGKTGAYSADTARQFRRAWTGTARIGVGGGGHFKAHGIECPQGTGVFQIIQLQVKP